MYKYLPALAEENERVVSFSIAPLENYCDAATSILNDISNNNVEDVSLMMVHFQEVQQYLNLLKETKFAADFFGYMQLLFDLESRYKKFENNMKSLIQKILPNIRSSSEDEIALTELITEYFDSCYYKDSFSLLLDVRRKEIETIESIIYNEELVDSKVVVDLDDTGAGNECMLQNDFSLMYSMEVLPTLPQQLGDVYENGTWFDDESSKWFMLPEVMGQNRPLLRNFAKFSKLNQDKGICFIVSLKKYSDEDVPFKLSLLKYGKEVIPSFIPPGDVLESNAIERDFDRVTLEVQHTVEDSSMEAFIEAEVTGVSLDNVN